MGFWHVRYGTMDSAWIISHSAIARLPAFENGTQPALAARPRPSPSDQCLMSFLQSVPSTGLAGRILCTLCAKHRRDRLTGYLYTMHWSR